MLQLSRIRLPTAIARLQKGYSAIFLPSNSHHSSIPVFARARDKNPSTLSLLTEAYQEKVEVDTTNVELVNLPENVSEEFFLDYERVSKSLSGDEDVSALKTNEGFSLLIHLLKCARNREELEIVQNLTGMWIRSGRILTKAKSVKLLDMCLLLGREQLAFSMLSNRSIYSLRPEPSHIFTLLKYFGNQATLNNDSSMLDMAYKCFVLNLYYDIPPTVEAYSFLIACGNYMSDPNGVKLSLVTLNEMRSLGWTPNSVGVFSLVHHFLKEENPKKAMEHLNELDRTSTDTGEQKQSLLFQTEVHLKLGNLEAASEAFQKASSITSSNNGMLFGMQYWRKASDLAKEFQKEQ